MRFYVSAQALRSQIESQQVIPPSPAQRRADLIDGEGEDVGRTAHVAELKPHPAPGVSLSFDDGHGADTLHGEDIKDEQADADER